MSGFIKYFDNGGKNVSFVIEDNSVNIVKHSDLNIVIFGTKLKKLKE